ncbi:MAG: SGNH/GDSL hydrolase family protein [Pirellulaceae bacterium]
MATHPETTRNPQRQARFRLAALLLGLLLGAAASLGLLALRARLFPSTQWVYLYEEGHEKTGHRFIHDARLGWRNIPNWTGTTFGVPLSINSQGLRDREYSIAKPAGKNRILVLGDSYAWGYGVRNSQMFSEVLEDRFIHDVSWQVINAAVSGWGTDQQFLFLEESGFDYQPDVVVVSFFFGNDFREISTSHQYALDKPVFIDHKLTLANVPVPKPRKDGLNPLYESTVHSFDLAITILKRMAAECEKRNCRLVVLKFGTYLDPATRVQTKNMIDTLAEISVQFSAALKLIPNLAYLDLDEQFSARDLTFEEIGIVPSRDYHWNANGHEAVASILATFLSNEGIIGTPNATTTSP